jgi:hypothetical protein
MKSMKYMKKNFMSFMYPSLVGVCNPDHNVHVFALKIEYPLQSSHTDYPKTNANTPVIPHEHADGVANPVRQ